jgi:excisionase family DNA binding protein
LENSKDYLTVKEVKEDLVVGLNTAYEIFKRKDFPARRLGRAFKVDKEAYEIWKKQRRTKED